VLFDAGPFFCAAKIEPKSSEGYKFKIEFDYF